MTFRGVLEVSINGDASVKCRTSNIVDAIRPMIAPDRVRVLWDDERSAFAIIGSQHDSLLDTIAAKVNRSPGLLFRVQPYRGSIRS